MDHGEKILDNRINTIREFIEWIQKLKWSMSGFVTEIEESTRMVVSFASIISAYDKDFWKELNKIELCTLFFMATKRVDGCIQSKRFKEGETLEMCGQCLKNIEERYNSLLQICYSREGG